MDISKQLATSLRELESSYKEQFEDIHREIIELKKDMEMLYEGNKKHTMSQYLQEIVSATYPKSTCSHCFNAMWAIEDSRTAVDGETTLTFSCLLQFTRTSVVHECSQAKIYDPNSVR